MKYPVYLDNNSTTPLDPRVLETMLPVFTAHFGNPASSSHEYGWYAAELIQIAREQTASAIGASPGEIVFTSGATESTNIALQGVIDEARRSSRSIRPHVVTGATEHRATLDTLRALESRAAIELTVLAVDETGALSRCSVERALKRNTVLVSFMLANNEIGTVHPIGELSAAARERGILFHCDATQALGKIPVDVNELGADLLSLSAHKIYGPKGAGALYLRAKTTAGKISPLVYGGGHEGGYRSGTLNVPGIAGLGRAAELAASELDSVRSVVLHLSKRLIDELTAAEVPFNVNGPPLAARLPGNLNLSLTGAPAAGVLPALQGKVACSASSACSSAEGLKSHVLAALGFPAERIDSSIRLGIGRFNTEEEIVRAAKALAEAAGRIARQ